MAAGETPGRDLSRVWRPPTNQGAGFKAFQDQKHRELALAHDEHLTAQERLRRYQENPAHFDEISRKRNRKRSRQNA